MLCSLCKEGVYIIWCQSFSVDMYGVYLLYTCSEGPLLVYGKLSAQDMLQVNRNLLVSLCKTCCALQVQVQHKNSTSACGRAFGDDIYVL